MEIISVKKRVTEDELKIDGRTFKLKKYDPLLGNYIITKLFTFTLPFGLSDMIKSQVAGTENIPASNSNAPTMNKAEFLDLQRDILSNCYELLPGDEAPVIRENGTYGISNFTSKIAIQLLVASLAFNYTDFFDAFQSIGEGDQ